MRPWITLGGCFLLGLLTVPAQGAPLQFLGNKNIAPVIYVEDGNPTGVAVDIVQALGRHLSQPIVMKAMDWKEAQAMVAGGEADALVQINRTEERTKIYDFSDPLLESQFSIFVRSDRVGVSGLSSLQGQRVGVEAAGLPRQVLEKNATIQLTTIPNFIEGFHMVSHDVIDAVVVDYRVGSYVLAQNNIRNIRAAGAPIALSFSAIAVKKGNEQLLSEINRALHAIRADGTYQKILDRWKPTETVFHTRGQIRRLTSWAASLGLALLVLVVAGWILTMRRELVRRRAAEARLREQYSTLHSIINSGDTLVFSVDREFRYTTFNHGHAGMMHLLYGVQIELGKSLLDYMKVETDRLAAKVNLQRALAGERHVQEGYSGEEPRSRQYFRVCHSPIKADRGDIIGVAVLAQDLTERKHVEEEVRLLNRDLDDRVRERTAELKNANSELEAFAYSVSHDLRAPVRHIDSFVGLLRKNLDTSVDERSRHYLEQVSESSKRMGALIDDLLSFSRMGRQELSRRPVDFAQIVRDVIRECEPEAHNRSVQWQVGELPIATGDYAMLRQVLSNLILNALKFSRARDTAHIEIGWKSDQKDETVIFVRDNGVGFDMRYAAKLFRVFQRLHASTDFEGTGIGLANVQRIIQRHGGRTWAEGTVNQGATFYFSLPNRSTPAPSH